MNTVIPPKAGSVASRESSLNAGMAVAGFAALFAENPYDDAAYGRENSKDRDEAQPLNPLHTASLFLHITHMVRILTCPHDGGNIARRKPRDPAVFKPPTGV